MLDLGVWAYVYKSWLYRQVGISFFGADSSLDGLQYYFYLIPE